MKFDYRLALEQRKRAIRELESLIRISADSGTEPDVDLVVELTDFIRGRRTRRESPGDDVTTVRVDMPDPEFD